MIQTSALRSRLFSDRVRPISATKKTIPFLFWGRAPLQSRVGQHSRCADARPKMEPARPPESLDHPHGPKEDGIYVQPHHKYQIDLRCERQAADLPISAGAVCRRIHTRVRATAMFVDEMWHSSLPHLVDEQIWSCQSLAGVGSCVLGTEATVRRSSFPLFTRDCVTRITRSLQIFHRLSPPLPLFEKKENACVLCFETFLRGCKFPRFDRSPPPTVHNVLPALGTRLLPTLSVRYRLLIVCRSLCRTVLRLEW